jgi:hypothetical protein
MRLTGAGVAGWLVLACCTVQAFTADITVTPGTVLMDRSKTIAITDLVPSACSGQDTFLSQTGALLRGAGGTRDSIWLSNGNANINAGNKSDCILPGSSATNITIGGGSGNDVCYRGPGPGTYTFNNCNTILPSFTGYFTDPSAGP